MKGWDDEYKHYGEWLYYIKSLSFGEIKYTDKIKAYYRRHEDNITNTFRDKKVKKVVANYKNRCRKECYKISDKTIKNVVKYCFFKCKAVINEFR